MDTSSISGPQILDTKAISTTKQGQKRNIVKKYTKTPIEIHGDQNLPLKLDSEQYFAAMDWDLVFQADIHRSRDQKLDLVPEKDLIFA